MAPNSNIRRAVLDRLEARRWSRYRLVLELRLRLGAEAPAPSGVYAWLAGSGSISDAAASQILAALKLRIR